MTLTTTHREQLEYALVSGAAAHLAHAPESATNIANGIKAVLNALHPTCAQIDAAAITLPVVDPGPDSLEREIQAKGANVAPRVTPDALKAEILYECYFNSSNSIDDWHGTPAPGCDSDAIRKYEQSLGLLTICVLVLRNGFTVVGHSACASPENFNAEIGRRIARENAERQIWPLLGFRLRDELAAA